MSDAEITPHHFLQRRRNQAFLAGGIPSMLFATTMI